MSKKFSEKQNFNSTSFKFLNKSPPVKIPTIEIPRNINVINEEIDTQEFEEKEIMKYHTFTVDQDGLYNIYSQLCIQCKENEILHSLQFGVCQDNLEDNNEIFLSLILNSECEEGNILSNLISCYKYLSSSKKYILWSALTTDNKSSFSINGDYSKLRIFKI